MTQEIHQSVADALLDIEAVGFSPDKPVTFKSGIVSPVYVDNRRLPFHPETWAIVIEAFVDWIDAYSLSFDAIAGIEAAGIPHSAALGYRMKQPSLFVRKQPKDHGRGKQVEGGNVEGKRVLLVEDLVTTGGSSLAGVTALRKDGAVVTDCIAIVSYGFDEALAAFDAHDVRLHILAPFTVLAHSAHQRGQFDADTLAVISSWRDDPWGWEQNQNRS
jgi:orotate phosphoribosyltransferase